MKYIVAIIQPDRLDEVIAALEEEEINLMTVSDVMGRGRQKGISEVLQDAMILSSGKLQSAGRLRVRRR